MKEGREQRGRSEQTGKRKKRKKKQRREREEIERRREKEEKKKTEKRNGKRGRTNPKTTEKKANRGNEEKGEERRKQTKPSETAAAPPGVAVREQVAATSLRHNTTRNAGSHRHPTPGNSSSPLFWCLFFSFSACRTNSVLHAGVGGN
jgi:hypothetical protein